jgi:hypothetical protein
MPPKKKEPDSSSPRESRKKPVGDIMIPRRRDFMGDLGDWIAESPENEKEFEAMLEEIFEEVAQNRKARGEVPSPSGKRSSGAKKKLSTKKPTLEWKVKLPVDLPSAPMVPLPVASAKSPAKKRSKKK